MLVVLGLLYAESSRLIWRTPRITIGMTEAEVDELLTPPVGWMMSVRHAMVRGGDLGGGMARGVETADHFEEWEDETAWVQVGFNARGQVTGFWMLERQQRLRWSRK
jgi:hypothetical protein